MDSVEDKIRGLLVKSFDMKPEEITPETNLKDDLEMDSLEMVEVVVKGIYREPTLLLCDAGDCEFCTRYRQPTIEHINKNNPRI